MTVLNHTPFPAMAFRQYNLRGEINGVVVARGTFRLVQNDALRILETQDALPLSDVYAGDPHRTPLVAQGVLVPFKPGTDITLLGSAYAAEAGTAASWLCGLRVGPVSKALRVHGARRWEPAFDGSRLAGWRLSEPEPVAEVPLEWGRAYGGPLPRGPDEAETVCPRNPLGCGIVDLEKTAIGPGESRPAPQIEAPEVPIGAWNDAPEPQGFGPVPPWWAQRLPLAGNFDDAWRDVRHPLLPADFDYRFYQCAPPGLMAEPWLTGDEAFQLVNLVPGPVRLHGRLPGLRLRMRLEQADGDMIRDLVLDGVEFDLRSQVAKVFLTWRAGFAWADGRGMPELALVPPLDPSEAAA